MPLQYSHPATPRGGEFPRDPVEVAYRPPAPPPADQGVSPPQAPAAGRGAGWQHHDGLRLRLRDSAARRAFAMGHGRGVIQAPLNIILNFVRRITSEISTTAAAEFGWTRPCTQAWRSSSTTRSSSLPAGWRAGSRRGLLPATPDQHINTPHCSSTVSSRFFHDAFGVYSALREPG